MLRTARGEADRYLVEIDEQEAAEVIGLLDRIYREDPTMSQGL